MNAKNKPMVTTTMEASLGHAVWDYPSAQVLRAPCVVQTTPVIVTGITCDPTVIVTGIDIDCTTCLKPLERNGRA